MTCEGITCLLRGGYASVVCLARMAVCLARMARMALRESRWSPRRERSDLLRRQEGMPSDAPLRCPILRVPTVQSQEPRWLKLAPADN